MRTLGTGRRERQPCPVQHTAQDSGWRRHKPVIPPLLPRPRSSGPTVLCSGAVIYSLGSWATLLALALNSFTITSISCNSSSPVSWHFVTSPALSVHLCILLPLELQLQYTIPGFREICLLKTSAQNKPALYLASVHLPHKTRTLKVIKPHTTLLCLVNTSFKHLLGTRLCQVPIFKAASTAVLPFGLGR